jgi:hypothetical protein
MNRSGLNPVEHCSEGRPQRSRFYATRQRSRNHRKGSAQILTMWQTSSESLPGGNGPMRPRSRFAGQKMALNFAGRVSGRFYVRAFPGTKIVLQVFEILSAGIADRSWRMRQSPGRAAVAQFKDKMSSISGVSEAPLLRNLSTQSMTLRCKFSGMV